MKRAFGVLAVALVLTGCGDPAEAWLQDGFMGDVSQEKWNGATPVQQVGTAGIWLNRIQADDLLVFKVPVAELKPKATELAQCINELVAKGGAVNKEAYQQGIVCINMLGWSKGKD